MRKQRLALALGSFCLCLSTPVKGADHLDAPNLSGDGQVDIADVYAFQSPNDPNSSVLIMTVNPFSGQLSPTSFGTSTGARNVGYQIQVDNVGDAVANVTYAASFLSPVGGSQGFNLTRNGSLVASGTTGMATSVQGGGQVIAGNFDDPFFFDLVGFSNGHAYTGDDFFAGANVSAIVLEVPNSELGGNIGVWASTIADGAQVDRKGRPAINTVLISGDDRKQEFNEASPDGDFAEFGGEVNSAIASLSSQANADALTPILLADVLTFNTGSDAGFLNGRGLIDDVIDTELGLLTEGALTSDLVDANDRLFRTVFPYLASANAIPEPSGVFALLVAIPAIAGRRRRRSNV